MALESNNLFLPSSYEHNLNMDNFKSEIEKRAYLTQILEYGQTPIQIF